MIKGEYIRSLIMMLDSVNIDIVSKLIDFINNHYDEFEHKSDILICIRLIYEKDINVIPTHKHKIITGLIDRVLNDTIAANKIDYDLQVIDDLFGALTQHIISYYNSYTATDLSTFIDNLLNILNKYDLKSDIADTVTPLEIKKYCNEGLYNFAFEKVDNILASTNKIEIELTYAALGADIAIKAGNDTKLQYYNSILNSIV